MNDITHNVLLVEDSVLQRVGIQKMLASMDVNVITAESGEEALDKFQKNPIFIVLLDVVLPGMDGFQVAKSIRNSDHPNQTVPIIFITATQSESENVFEGYDSGGVDYILKPVEPHSLRSKVKVFLQLTQQRETIEEQLNEIRAKNVELKQKFAEIDMLRGLVPICAACKSIRDVSGYWKTIEQYFSDDTDTELSHSICPGCYENLYPTVVKTDMA